MEASIVDFFWQMIRKRIKENIEKSRTDCMSYEVTCLLSPSSPVITINSHTFPLVFNN